eukprot:TRINITY_DN250_c4_g1_i1.p1 TRINITY_DN250_c4_g1~~TRINITY_DN250_c4_g1_i1.p1  ORF type:complete len:268 (+),score=84.80 TRINITY_DN250_c4_g1_i1:60-863(+)
MSMYPVLVSAALVIACRGLRYQDEDPDSVPGRATLIQRTDKADSADRLEDLGLRTSAQQASRPSGSSSGVPGVPGAPAKGVPGQVVPPSGPLVGDIYNVGDIQKPEEGQADVDDGKPGEDDDGKTDGKADGKGGKDGKDGKGKAAEADDGKLEVPDRTWLPPSPCDAEEKKDEGAPSDLPPCQSDEECKRQTELRGLPKGLSPTEYHELFKLRKQATQLKDAVKKQASQDLKSDRDQDKKGEDGKGKDGNGKDGKGKDGKAKESKKS